MRRYHHPLRSNLHRRPAHQRRTTTTATSISNSTALRALLESRPAPVGSRDIHFVVDALNLDIASSYDCFRTALVPSDFTTPSTTTTVPLPPNSMSMNALRDVFSGSPFKLVCLDEDTAVSNRAGSFAHTRSTSTGTAATEATTSTLPAEVVVGAGGDDDGGGTPVSPTIDTMRILARLHPQSICISLQVDSGPESGDYFGAALVGSLDKYYAERRRRKHVSTKPRPEGAVVGGDEQGHRDEGEGLPLFVVISNDQLFRRSLERSFPGGVVVYPPALTPTVLVPFLRSLFTTTPPPPPFT